MANKTVAETSISYGWCDSPVGRLLLAGDADTLTLVGFPSGSRAEKPAPGWREQEAPPFAETRRQLAAYFAGELTQFELPLRPIGTAFQKAVWMLLAEIPFGETVSYGFLANRLGRPTASRAVGAANGANPLPIILPCHRVIGSTGALTGFGGGIETKRFLLAHEARLARRNAPQGELF